MMKIIYTLGLTLSITASSFAQQDTVTFESFLSTPNSHDNGDDLSGGFIEDGVHFSNFYDTTWSYFTGFAISNETDVTTPGSVNQYSCFAGTGDSSSNYGVFYQAGTIDLGTGANYLSSVRVTNTTFSALSMTNGDAYGKKFGDSTDANGLVDGTNGEDFYKLKIISLSENNDTVGYTEIYLADYRFADNSQDYILDEWTTVDLTTLNAAVLNPRYVQFELSSSDISSWGINTPAYFALDNLVFENYSLGLDELESNFKVYPNPVKEKLNIENAVGQVSISDISGKIVQTLSSTGSVSVDFSNFPNGAYLVTVSNSIGKVTRKVLK